MNADAYYMLDMILSSKCIIALCLRLHSVLGRVNITKIGIDFFLLPLSLVHWTIEKYLISQELDYVLNLPEMYNLFE